MKRIGILGATGYTAREVLYILLRHPEVEVSLLTSRRDDSPHVASVHPTLRGRLDLKLEPLDVPGLKGRVDAVFCCLPHGVSPEWIPQLLEDGIQVVDLSADYRLRDPAVYAEWYGGPHVDQDRLTDVPYGLPELFREQICGARLVANPGCYPTAATLALAPLLREGLIDPEDIVVDAKSGVSGAGRTPSLPLHFAECNESVAAYKVGQHRHTPEIEQNLRQTTGKDVQVIFTPHLMPMERGILATCYGRATTDATQKEILAMLRNFYEGEPFIHVTDELPATKDTAYTNFCHLTVRRVKGRILAISSIDNLIKGASGAAVQNFNLMCGFPEITALL